MWRGVKLHQVTLVLEPGMWSLDNFGDKAICLIHDGAVF